MIAASTPGDERRYFDDLHSCTRAYEIIGLRLTWEDVNFEKRAITLWPKNERMGNMNRTYYR